MIDFAQWLKSIPPELGDMSSCEECEKIHLEVKHILPDCDACNRPVILPTNLEALQVHGLCKHQLIVGMAGIVGMRLEAVKVAMDLLGVDDQITCAEKVLAFSEEFYRKEDI